MELFSGHTNGHTDTQTHGWTDRRESRNSYLDFIKRLKYVLDLKFQINGFQRECYAYNCLIKCFQQIRRENKLHELRVPKVLFSNENDGILIMENLKTKGFQLFDRINNGGMKI